MGWIWSDAPKVDRSTQTPTTQDDPRIKLEIPAAPNPAPEPAIKPRALTRDEQADAELQELLKEFNQPPETPPSVSKPLMRSPAQPIPSVNHSSISPDILYPKTMSCRATFDSAFYCQSLGGQFNSLYRFGGMRNCSDQWSAFWFCMRTNRGFMSEEEREKKIQRHYKSRAAKFETGPSSEDVWALREDRLEGAFEGNFEAVEEEMRREREIMGDQSQR